MDGCINLEKGTPDGGKRAYNLPCCHPTYVDVQKCHNLLKIINYYL